MAADTKTVPRKRVPAAERRDALIEAAVHHFAHGGLQGTKVSAIAADVGVAQPYVFSLFPTKRDLFLAAVGRCFEKVSALFEEAAAEFEKNGPQEPEEDKLKAIGHAYMGAIADNPDQLLLQLQAYAACGDDPEIQTSVRRKYAKLIELSRELTASRRRELDASSRTACGATSPPPSASRTSRSAQAGSRAPSRSTTSPRARKPGLAAFAAVRDAPGVSRRPGQAVAAMRRPGREVRREGHEFARTPPFRHTIRQRSRCIFRGLCQNPERAVQVLMPWHLADVSMPDGRNVTLQGPSSRTLRIRGLSPAVSPRPQPATAVADGPSLRLGAGDATFR